MLSRKEALEQLLGISSDKEHPLSGWKEFGWKEFYLSKETKDGFVIDVSHGKIINPKSEYWGFCDLNPAALWTHDCIYAVLTENGPEVKKHDLPPGKADWYTLEQIKRDSALNMDYFVWKAKVEEEARRLGKYDESPVFISGTPPRTCEYRVEILDSDLHVLELLKRRSEGIEVVFLGNSLERLPQGLRELVEKYSCNSGR